MTGEDRTYLCIDMKSFYASVECADRGLDPFETNLVVADPSRGKGAICLAISPRMKSLGVKNRCRLYEIPEKIQYEIAVPRMKRYIECSADIYELYLDYFAPKDMHVYSIDESFIDVTPYLKIYGCDGISLAKKLMKEIAEKTHIPSTAGVGTNLFLAKVALDITAKHDPDHIGYLNRELFKKTLWEHEPITDFWQIARGTAARLEKYGIKTMKGISEAPEELMYRLFGINAELLIDHANGIETCLMEDIKNYSSKNHSVSMSQILPRDYDYEEAALVMKEMTLNGCHELMKRHQVTEMVNIYVGYSKDTIPGAKGMAHIGCRTALYSIIGPVTKKLFEKITDKDTPIRRLGIGFGDVCGEEFEQYDLFTDRNAVEKEKSMEKAVQKITDKYGKNAVLRGMNHLEGATQKERNEMIGGHRAGYDETGKS